MDKEMATIAVEQEVNSSLQEPVPESSTARSPNNDDYNDDYNDDDDDDGRQHLGNFCQIIIKEEYATAEGLEMEAKRGCWGEDVDGASGEGPMLVRMAPDGRAFLATQLIPKCGAFCYPAVISKRKDE